MNRGAGVVVGAIVADVLLPIALLIGVVTLSEESAAACTSSAEACPTVSLTSLPAVDQYDAVQVSNLARIMNAASSSGLSVAAQKVGVMTAIGESRLWALGFGDVAGPDSRRLFQQSDSWGPLAVRMDQTGRHCCSSTAPSPALSEEAPKTADPEQRVFLRDNAPRPRTTPLGGPRPRTPRRSWWCPSTLGEAEERSRDEVQR